MPSVVIRSRIVVAKLAAPCVTAVCAPSLRSKPPGACACETAAQPALPAAAA